MPPEPSDSRSRRRLLAGLGTGLAAGLGGCAGRVPGAGPPRVESVETRTDRGIRWDYPPRSDSDRDGVGYAAVTVGGLRERAAGGPVLQAVLNSTVGGPTDEQNGGYRADWFRFRVGPVPSAADPAPRMRVQPPPWPALRVRYDREGRRRWLVVRAPGSRTGRPPDAPRCPAASRAPSASPPSTVGRWTRASSRPGGLRVRTARASRGGGITPKPTLCACGPNARYADGPLPGSGDRVRDR